MEDNKFPTVREGHIGTELVQTVDARELHTFLGVKSQFRDWIRNRIDDFGFSENVDYVTVAKNLAGGGRKNDYFISLDMGKELGMVERTPKGKEVRQYFIDCERRAKEPHAIPTTAEAFANAFQMIANTEKRQAQQEAKIAAISENVDRIAQSLMIHDCIPPNGELVTHLRKRVSKSFGLSFDVINRVLDTASVHPKFAVRNHHENAEGSVNYGYWQRDINLVFRKFVEECEQVTPTMCEHPYIDGRFRLIKKEIAPRSKNAVTLNGLGAF